MKNKLKLLLLPLLILGLTACGTTKQHDYKTAYDKTNDVKSLHVNYKIDMAVKSEGTTVEMPIVMDMDLDSNTKLAKAALSMKFLGVDVTVNEYLDMNNNLIYVESLEEDTPWTKQKMESFDTSKMIGSYKEAKKIDETDTEYHYQSTVTPKEFAQNLSLFGDMANDVALTKDVVVDIYINKKDNYITRIEADMKQAIEIEEAEYTKLKFIITLSNFDKVSVKSIDQSIIDSAVEAEPEE